MSPDDSPIPRREHPRPDFARSDWLSLNGRWGFCFDPEDQGVRGLWFSDNGSHFGDQIVVPYPWQSKLSEQCNSDYRGVAWYRRTFDVPNEWQGKRVFLRFGAVDYRADVWVNGKRLGSHEGGYSPFEFDTSACLQPGGNILVVRAEDPADLQEIPHGKQTSVPPDPWHNWEFTPVSGIWQTVWLEARPSDHVAGLWITPDVQGERVDLELRIMGGAGGSARLNVHIEPPSGKLIVSEADLDLEAGQVRDVRLSVSIPAPELWDIDTPHLYTVVLTLTGSDGDRDVVRSYFGMRQVEQRDGQVWLNGRPIYLMTALDQGYWPDGLYTAPDDEALRADVAYAKRMGFNGLRKHLKVEDPRFAYWADQMGLLLWCDVPSPTRFTDLACQRLKRDVMDMIDRDYNHPSIIIWCPYNETWGLEFQLHADPRKQEWVTALYDDIKAADPTRLVVDNSGWSHVKTDIVDFHYYTGNPSEWRRINDALESAPDEVSVHGLDLMASGHPYDGEPIVVSEYGAGGRHDLSWSLHWQTNELRRHARIVGYTYCQLYGVEHEVGCAHYDRSPKDFGYDVAMVNSLDSVILDYQGPLSVAPADEVVVPAFFSAYGQPALREACLHWKLIRTVPEGSPKEVLLSGQSAVQVEPYTVTQLNDIQFVVPEVQGPVQLWVWVEDPSGRIRARNWMDLESFSAQRPYEVQLTPGGASYTVRLGLDSYSECKWSGGFRSGFLVDDSPNAISMSGRGHIEYCIPLLVDIPGVLQELTLMFELAPCPPEVTQSVEGQNRPSAVTISLNRRTLKTVDLPDLHVNARGALTRIHNLGAGEHGDLVRITVPQELLPEIQADARRQAHFRLRLEVKPTAPKPGGLTLFGARAGRYGMSPTITIQLNPLT